MPGIYAWMSSPSADHLGSFLGGLSTLLVTLSLIAGYVKWKRDRKIEVDAIKKNKLDEKKRHKKELEQITAQFLDKINLSTGMLLVERGRIWAEALQWSANDRSARFVLVKAAVRTTMLASSNIESVIMNASENEVGGELKIPIVDAVRVLEMTAQEDIELIKYFSKKDDRIMRRLRNERVRRLEMDYTADRQLETADQSVDDLNEVLFSYFELPKLAIELSARLEKINLALDAYASAK